MKFFCILILILSISISILAQSSSPPQTTAISSPGQSASNDYGNRYEGERSNPWDISSSSGLPKRLELLYRKPNSSETAFLRVDESLKAKYKSVWFQRNAGIFTLMPDLGCADDIRILVTTEICQQLKLPGAGASYSFRINRYRLKRLADLSYSDNHFLSTGKFAQGILGNLGDVNIEKVTPNSQSVLDIASFTAEKNKDLINEQYNALEKGISKNGILFSNRLKVVENSTFILRNIAYNTKFFIAPTGFGTYNEFEFDKRTDIVVVFRVLKINEDGSLVVLWKKLAEKKSPKIKHPKEVQQEVS